MWCRAVQGIHLCPIMGYKMYSLQQYAQRKLKHLNVSPILPLTYDNTVEQFVSLETYKACNSNVISTKLKCIR